MGRLLHRLAVYFGLSEPRDEEAELAAADQDALRRRLRRPVYWLVIGVIACGIGFVAEGAASLAGDGRFDVAAAVRWSAAIFLIVSITRVWEGFGHD